MLRRRNVFQCPNVVFSRAPEDSQVPLERRAGEELLVARYCVEHNLTWRTVYSSITALFHLKTHWPKPRALSHYWTHM